MKTILKIACAIALATCSPPIFALSGCAHQRSKLDPDNPITLTMWHVYGEQADSPMSRLVDEFNETVGRERGIVIKIDLVSNSSQIGSKLLEAHRQEPGALDMPDLFFCHTSNAYAIGPEYLLDWSEHFGEDDRAKFVDAFLQDGYAAERLAVLPVTKSTHLLFINDTQFQRFSAETGVVYDDLSTWEGFFHAAEAYYEWSGGQAFCAFDYLLRSVELSALGRDATTPLYAEDGWYDPANEVFHDAWDQFAEALVEGHVVMSDTYSTTQVMTGESLGGLGSSAAILYYNDSVTYPDNTTEPMRLHVLPLPKPEGGQGFVTQAGVGLCAHATTEEKEEAAVVFARWLTEDDRNLAFAAETGYVPVKNDALARLSEHDFANENYRQLYEAIRVIHEDYGWLSEPNSNAYYARVYRFYDKLKAMLAECDARKDSGERDEDLVEETWALLHSMR